MVLDHVFQKGVRLPFFPHHISSQIPQTMTSSSEFPSMMRLCNQFNTFIGVTCTVIYIKFQTVVRLWGFSYQMLMDWLVTVSSLFWYLPGQYSMLSPRAWSLPISSSSVLSVCIGCTRWTLQMASPWCILRSIRPGCPHSCCTLSNLVLVSIVLHRGWLGPSAYTIIPLGVDMLFSAFFLAVGS